MNNHHILAVDRNISNKFIENGKETGQLTETKVPDLKSRSSVEPSVIITSPGHDDIKSVEIVMHAHSSGYWQNRGVKVILCKVKGLD